MLSKQNMQGLTYIEPALPLLLAALALGFLGLGRLRWRDRCRGGIGLATVVLFFWSWPPVATVMMGTLEWWYPRASPPPNGMDAIVVLSATFDAPNPPWPRTVPNFETYLRVRCAAWLHQNGWPLPVLATGGRQGDRLMAEIMKEALVKEGVPAAQIWTESESTSTYENALFSAQLLRARGLRKVVLVTEAYHMLRAAGCFRKAGLEVFPAPCHYTTFEGRLEEWLPHWRAIARNDAVLHEWLGLFWYKLRGWI